MATLKKYTLKNKKLLKNEISSFAAIRLLLEKYLKGDLNPSILSNKNLTNIAY